MCVHVRPTSNDTPSWSRPDVAIDIPGDIDTALAVLLVREILTSIGVAQPSETTMATCFCGEPVDFRPLAARGSQLIRVPRQDSRSKVEASHGA